ncbi:MAG TPA: sulfurtransferase [Candidatus Angelobacter sp.]|nr:sulfurtransferase [Candidatus Angelobacter sp.]
MSEFISLEEVKNRLTDPNIVIVDCRFDLTQKEAGHSAYHEGHLPGAIYFDLEKDLSSPIGQHGGRHPLPNVSTLAEKLGHSGIDESKTVIAYDDQNGSMAARLWWLLKYYGHDRVFVTQEGFSSWVKKGYPVTTSVPDPEPRAFLPKVKEEWTVNVSGVRELQNYELLMDARAPERYRGDVEPLDPKAGHIPGAANSFWMENLKEGKWLSKEALRTRFEPFQNQPITVYCGSGVTACALMLAMTEGGLTKVRLYPGSWSDWVSYEENPVETGDGKK